MRDSGSDAFTFSSVGLNPFEKNAYDARVRVRVYARVSSSREHYARKSMNTERRIPLV